MPISQGFKVLRFWNNEVLTNTLGVLEVVRINCLSHPPLNPLPSREGKEEEEEEERFLLREGKERDKLPSREGNLPT
jgi:hypothetical protein